MCKCNKCVRGACAVDVETAGDKKNGLTAPRPLTDGVPMNDHQQPISTVPAAQGLYDPQNEHDACGVGFAAHIKGKKSHEIIQQGLKILENLDHRGAVGADPLMGDGAGILLQMPDALLNDWARGAGKSLPAVGRYAVAMCFLPRDPTAREYVIRHFEQVVAKEGQSM